MPATTLACWSVDIAELSFASSTTARSTQSSTWAQSTLDTTLAKASTPLAGETEKARSVRARRGSVAAMPMASQTSIDSRCRSIGESESEDD